VKVPGRFLTARWRHLAMLNYEVDPAVLAHRVPAGTELDTFDGRTFVSLVGFRFLDTRLLGVPIPFHRDFDEVNLRFYVRREGPGGEVRRGVVFVKELVPRWALAAVARWVYNENYQALPMDHAIELGPKGGRVGYRWRHGGRWQGLAVDVEGAPELTSAGSVETFITEHYWGYARQRDGGTIEYQVEHPRWQVWRATHAELELDVAGLYGAELAPALAGLPHSALLADGSEIVVRRGRRID
jgi:uncharacterized protein YqjF (DUF2071 family)